MPVSRSLRILFTTAAVLAIGIGSPTPSFAKAHLVAVFQLRSTPMLAHRATAITRAVADRIAALPGYDSTVLSGPLTGGLGTAAAAAGAEVYVVGQLVEDANGYAVTCTSFDASNDVELHMLKATLTTADALPVDADFSALFLSPQATSSATAISTNLVSGLTIGTPIDLFIDTPISSGAAKVGQTFLLHAAHDVYSSDGAHLSIAKGAPGFGEVQAVDNAGGNGHGGKLTLQFDWVVATDGNKIPLTNAQNSTEGGDAKGASSTATIASYVLLGPLGLFAHNFVRGKDAVISTTTPLTAYVDRAIRPTALSTLAPTGPTR